VASRRDACPDRRGANGPGTIPETAPGAVTRPMPMMGSPQATRLSCQEPIWTLGHGNYC
jgi:hypothetical protein